MNPQPAIIIDYASPHGRAKIALPARSVLTLHTEPGHVLIGQRLEFKDGAIAAIAFAIFVLAVMAYLLVTVRHTAAVIVPFWLVEFSLLLKVIHDTFHETRLEAWPDRLNLQFRSPFRRREYSWPAQQITSIDPRPAAGNFVPTLGTLLIVITDGPSLHLFTGHPHTSLVNLTQHLYAVLQPGPIIPQS